MAEYKIVVNRKNIKNLRMTLKEGNILVISAPLFSSNRDIESFINNNREWITKAINKHQERLNNSYLYRGGTFIYLFGYKFLLTKKTGNNKIEIRDNTMTIYSRNDSIDYLYKKYNSDLNDCILEYLNKYLFILQDYKYHQVPIIKYRKMTSRWGVCYPKKNTILINSYLIHYPKECIEYVLLHELCHFIVPNHSKRFYSIIENNLHNYKDIVKKLV